MVKLWMVSKISLDYLGGPYTIIRLITKEDKGDRIRRRWNDGSRGGSNAIALKGGCAQAKEGRWLSEARKEGTRIPPLSHQKDPVCRQLTLTAFELITSRTVT